MVKYGTMQLANANVLMLVRYGMVKVVKTQGVDPTKPSIPLLFLVIAHQAHIKMVVNA